MWSKRTYSYLTDHLFTHLPAYHLQFPLYNMFGEFSVGLRGQVPDEFVAVVENQVPPSPFYFEDSQVVLQASRIIATLSP